MSTFLSGIIPAALTPFQPDGSLNLPVVEQQADFFHEAGISAVFVGGSTGESHSLTVEERIALAHKWCVTSRDRFQVAVHVGHNCLKDARTMATRAQVSGAAAISAMAPFGIKPSNLNELIEYLALVSAAAPGLPFYYYHIPVVTGVDYPIEQVLEQGAKRIPSFRGVKFTSFNLPQFTTAAALDGGRFDMLYGHDEALLPALAAGAEGAIGSTYNYAPAVYQRLWQAFAAGEMARARQEQVAAIRLIDAIIPFGVLRASKVLMRWSGIDVGPVRPPLIPLSAEEQDRLYAAVKDLPVFSRKLHRQ